MDIYFYVVSKTRLKYIVLHADYLLDFGNAKELELEIRSCSIIAVKRVCDRIKEFVYGVTDVLDFVKPYKIPVLVDNILFSLLELGWFDNGENEFLLRLLNITTQY